MSVLSAVLALMLVSSFGQMLARTNWTSLFSDRSNDQIFEIPDLGLVPEIPLSEKSLDSLLKGNIPSNVLDIKVINSWKSSIFSQDLTFPDLVKKALGSSYPKPSSERGLQGMRFALTASIPSRIVSSIDRPSLFWNKFHGNWTLYANGMRIAEGDGSDIFVTVRLPRILTQQDITLVWIIENSNADKLYGPNYRSGISLRSTLEATTAKKLLPLQFELPHLLSSTTYLIFALLAAIFAISMKQYTDLWAFSAFMAAMACAVWAETPYYIYSFEWVAQRSNAFMLARALIHSAVVLSSVSLTLSFFRLRGYSLWLTLFFSLVMLAGIVAVGWPYGNKDEAVQIRNFIGTGMVLTLIPAHLVSFSFGWTSLIKDYRKLKFEGLNGYLPALRRRFAESGLFTIGMLVMLVCYAVTMPVQSSIAGSDIFLMSALIPALILFIEIYWMMGASARLREQLMPQLNYADFLCLFLYELSIDGLYHGALFVGDLRGFKKITNLKKKSPQHRAAVQTLLKAVHRDLMAFVEKDRRVVFRFKKNGDEWIWAFFAKDEQQSVEIYCELMSSWAKASGPLIKSWKDLLTRSLGSALTTEDAEVVENLGMHLMSCPLRGMRLDADDDMSRPDFEADEFTTLSAIFKITAHQSVGSIESDAKLLIERHPELGFKCREPSVSEWKAAGVAEPPAGVVLLEWTGHLQDASDDQDVGPGQDASSLPSAS